MTSGNRLERIRFFDGARRLFVAVFLWSVLWVVGFAQAVAQSEVAGNTNAPEVRGVVKAGAEATISSEIAARIVELSYKEGEPFMRGETLVGFDCAYYQARARAAAAELSVHKKKYENNQQLARLDAVGDLEVAVSASQVDKARAELAVARLRIDNCDIEAPYDGRIVERLVNVHESVGADQKLIRIVQSSAPTIELIVPSSWLTWLERGTRFTFLIDEIRATRPAVVDRLGAMVDPVSNTVNVYGRFDGEQGDVLAGMSGTARFPARGEGGNGG